MMSADAGGTVSVVTDTCQDTGMTITNTSVKPGLFERASQCFEGWSDPDTGLRVLRLATRERGGGEWPWHTLYHQCDCFLDGGRTIVLTAGPGLSGTQPYCLLDLTTGEMTDMPIPEGTWVFCVLEGSRTAVLIRNDPAGAGVILWDIDAERTVMSFDRPGWSHAVTAAIEDGQRVLAVFNQGDNRQPPCRSEMYLLDPDRSPQLVFKSEGYFCNHVQSCPTDPHLFAYDRWPVPPRPTDQVIYLCRLDGSDHAMLPMNPDTRRPGSLWGGQRDHYVWTPDGNAIASYFSPIDSDSKNHYEYGWWVSVMNWRTGRDLAQPYPTDRWSGHFRVTPDSRTIIAAGMGSFQKIFAIDIEGLRDGWNERVLCSYPKTIHIGENEQPYHQPWVLSDQSGVVFTAGWPGPEWGTYMVELPADLRGSASLK